MELPLDKFDGIDKTDVQRDDDFDEQQEQLELQISNKRGLKKDHKKMNKLGEEKTRKELVERRKKMKRVISLSGAQPSKRQRVGSPLVRSPGVNLLISSAAALNGGRSPSMMFRSPSFEERIESQPEGGSQYVSRSQSPTTSPLGGSRSPISSKFFIGWFKNNTSAWT